MKSPHARITTVVSSLGNTVLLISNRPWDIFNRRYHPDTAHKYCNQACITTNAVFPKFKGNNAFFQPAHPPAEPQGYNLHQIVHNMSNTNNTIHIHLTN